MIILMIYYDKYVNVGKKWNINEEKKMLKMLENKKNYNEIANELKRSQKGIKTRIKKIVNNLHEEGKTIEEISEIINLSSDVVNYMIKINTTNQLSKKDDENIIPLLKEIKESIKLLIKIEIEKFEVNDVESEWNDKLILEIENNIENKKELKKIRKENNITKDIFYEKVKEIKENF